MWPGLGPEDLLHERVEVRAVLRVAAGFGLANLAAQAAGRRRRDRRRDFDFLPDWFLEPLDAKLALQRGLAHTQMLCSFIHERRDADARAGAA